MTNKMQIYYRRNARLLINFTIFVKLKSIIYH